MEQAVKSRASDSLKSSRTTGICTCLFLILFLTGFPALHAQEGSSQIVIYLEKINFSSESDLHFRDLTLQGEYSSNHLSLVNPDVHLPDLNQQQILLAESLADPGQYSTLRISLLTSDPALEADSTDSLVRIISLPLNLDLKADRAQSLFLRWSPASADDSISPGHFQLIRKIIPPVTALAFVSNETSGNVSIIDRTAGVVVGVIRVGQDPCGMAFSTQRNLLFVANAQSNSVSVIDVLAQIPRTVIDLDYGDEPRALCLSADERRLFTANRGSSTVTLINALTFTRTDKVNVGSNPVDIVLDPSSGWVYTANSMSDDVSAFNPSAPLTVRTMPVGSFPAGLELDDKNHLLYVANYYSGNVTQIKTGDLTVLGTLNSSHSISDLAGDFRAGNLYCALEDLNLVAVLKPSLNLDLTRIPVGSSPARMSLDPEGTLLYVTCAKSNNISIINCNAGRLKGTIAAGQKPWGIVFP